MYNNDWDQIICGTWARDIYGTQENNLLNLNKMIFETQ